MYYDLLFDVDDTLLQFEKGQHDALRTIFKTYGVSYEEGLETFQSISRSLWEAAERGDISIQTILTTRFTKWLEAFELEGDGVALDEQFRASLSTKDYQFPGARQLLERLAPSYRLSIVTNGVGETQKQRLQASSLDDYFPHRFISSEIGVQKPHVEFFEAVFHQLPSFQAERALVIGDSLTSDMEGARRAGLASCWFNPNGKPLPSLPIDYVIASYDELERLLRWNEPVRVRLDHFQLEEDKVYVGPKEALASFEWSDSWQQGERQLKAYGFLPTTKRATDVLDFDTRRHFTVTYE